MGKRSEWAYLKDSEDEPEPENTAADELGGISLMLFILAVISFIALVHFW